MIWLNILASLFLIHIWSFLLLIVYVYENLNGKTIKNTKIIIGLSEKFIKSSWNIWKGCLLFWLAGLTFNIFILLITELF